MLICAPTYIPGNHFEPGLGIFVRPRNARINIFPRDHKKLAEPATLRQRCSFFGNRGHFEFIKFRGSYPRSDRPGGVWRRVLGCSLVGPPCPSTDKPGREQRRSLLPHELA